MKQMKRLFVKRLFAGVIAATVMAAVVGCGGGSNGTNPTSLYAGTYTGSYAGTTTTGSAVSGRFTVSAANDGSVTGNLIGPNNNLPVTGTIDNAGNLRFSTATGGANVISVAGLLGSVDGTYVADGTFSSTVGGVANASSGRAIAIRALTTDNQFAGNYTGTFTSTDPAGTQGTITVTADKDGAILGNVNQTGVATVYSATGVVTPAGNVTLYAVGDKGGQPRLQFITKFSGSGSIANTIATLTGNYATSEAGVITIKGNFTLTEQPIP